MVPFYSSIARFVNQSGILQQPWISFLQQFVIAPPAFMPIVVGTSPFAYQAKEPGNVFISGGTVSSITLTRGSDTIIVASSTVNPRLIPVAIDDTVTVTYSVLPTMKFISSYGQNTTS